MSFSMLKAGTVDEVRAAVEDHNVYGDPLGETTKAFIDAALQHQGAPKVIVEASGHSYKNPDGSAGISNVSVTIRPMA